MMKLWKRFTAWLHYLRHPCTIITMDEAPAKGVNVNFTYGGEYGDVLDFLPKVNTLLETLIECGEHNRKLERSMDNEENNDEPQEPKYGTIDYVDHCMNNLGMSLNFADPDGTLSSKGYKNDNEKQIWQAVLGDYRTLSDAIAALRKE